MVAELKMRNFRIRGSGDVLSDILTVANVHVHSRTAKKECNEGASAYKAFWDELAFHLVQYGARILIGDFNMAFFCVIVELRGRGFQINMAAWYPFYMKVKRQMRAESCGIFSIGPLTGVRLIYDCGVFDIPPPPRTPNNSMVMEELKDEHGKVMSMEPYKTHEYVIQDGQKVQGYRLKSYQPEMKTRRAQYLKWNFDYVVDQGTNLRSRSLSG